MVVKMVYANNRIDFEDAVNEALKNLQEQGFTIIDIKYSCVVSNRFKEHSAMIIYEDR